MFYLYYRYWYESICEEKLFVQISFKFVPPEKAKKGGAMKFYPHHEIRWAYLGNMNFFYPKPNYLVPSERAQDNLFNGV